MTTTTNHPDVAPPARCREGHRLGAHLDNEVLHRFFVGPRRDTDKACVGIVGFQNSDGTIRQVRPGVFASRDSSTIYGECRASGTE